MDQRPKGSQNNHIGNSFLEKLTKKCYHVKYERLGSNLVVTQKKPDISVYFYTIVVWNGVT